MARRTVYYKYGFEAGKDARYKDLAESSVETDVNDISIEMGSKFTERREADYRDGYHAGYEEADEWMAENARYYDDDEGIDVMAEMNAAALADIEANDELYRLM